MSWSNCMLSSFGKVLYFIVHHSFQGALHMLTEKSDELVAWRNVMTKIKNKIKITSPLQICMRHKKASSVLYYRSWFESNNTACLWPYLWKFLSVSSKWRRISSAHSVDGTPEILSLMLLRNCLRRVCKCISSSADRCDIVAAGWRKE